MYRRTAADEQVATTGHVITYQTIQYVAFDVYFASGTHKPLTPKKAKLQSLGHATVLATYLLQAVLLLLADHQDHQDVICRPHQQPSH